MGHLRDLTAIAPAFGSRPVVGVVHSGNFDSLFRRPSTALTGRALLGRLRALVFLSDGLAERCSPFVPDHKRWVVPNTIDAEAIPSPSVVEAERRRRVRRAGLRLLFLSGMIPSKGYGDLLDATALLRDRGVSAHARFVGRWPSAQDEAAFRASVVALDLEGQVEVVGGVGRRQARAFLLDADLMVLPTTYPSEAQPLTVIEALASGTPVIATHHAGLPEMIEDGLEGRFVAAHAPGEIADAAVGLLDPERWTAASRAARMRFEEAFSPDTVGRRWREVLRRIDRP